MIYGITSDQYHDWSLNIRENLWSSIPWFKTATIDVQQSVLYEGNLEGSQLFFPHIRFPKHSESLSQSPCPSAHGFVVPQHSCIWECVPEAQWLLALKPAICTY